ncbi:MAG: RNA polymerase subunit sigma-70, partial [Planctomycetes bacterium]|nr:RNA polymerase subunit sigma-70 [Planctomycetota bacterium]
MTDSLDQVSACLADLANGDETALDRLLPHIYDELRALARRMYRGDAAARTLNPTALVHEAYARLAQQDPRAYEGRQHFMKVAAIAI